MERADDRLLASIGFPGPPHRLAGGVPLGRRIAGYVAVGLLQAAGAAILVLYFGFGAEGRQLVVDSALGVGLGQAVAGTVEPGECRAYRSSGKYGTSGWFCTVVVVEGGRRTELLIDTRDRPELSAHRGVGRVLGAVGVYWSGGVMLDRWLSVLMLMVLALALLVLLPWAVGWPMRGVRRLARLRRGRVHTVELLTWSGTKWFGFVGDDGVRRIGEADFPGGALILDGVATTGVAVVRGREAVLLDEQLGPLMLAPEVRAGILARVAEVRMNGLRREALRPVAGDAPNLEGRLAAVEGADATYDACWRLIWDSTDAEVSRRALLARDAVVRRMGAVAADAALLATREGARQLVK